MPSHLDELEAILGYRPFPGTLNVELARPIHFKGGASWRGPDDGFARYVVPARLNGTSVFINRWSGCPYSRVDIVARSHLRGELDLNDGMEVHVDIERDYLRPLPVRAQVVRIGRAFAKLAEHYVGRTAVRR